MTKKELLELMAESISEMSEDNNTLKDGVDLSDLEMLHSDNGDHNYIEDNIMIMDISNISKSTIDKTLFQKGVNEMSELCGKITALVNIGITPDMALTYISEHELHKATGEYNMQVSKLNADSNIESAKYGSAVLSKLSM